MSKKVALIGLTILLAAFLRLYNLANFPPSLEWDEVATGYDAYSILKTGRDQFGHFLPLTIRSLDDYKPPLYTYLTAGSMAIFGWNDFAVRFPAAILGILAVFTTYGLTRELFKNEKLALLAALFLAVSPWHVNFSRLALETNSTIFFTTVGVWMFLAGLENGRYLVLSAILVGLDLYLYHNARVFIPLLGLVLAGLYFKQLRREWRWVLVSAVILLIFIIRLVPIVTSIEGQMRLLGTSIFTDAVPLDTYAQEQQYQNWKLSDVAADFSLPGRIFHSQKVLFGMKILKNYVSHFDPTFLLFTNDSPRHHASEVGLLYLIDLPLLLAGLYFLMRRQEKKTVVIILAWMLISPIPASVARDAPHALRSAIFLPTFQILAALGVVGLTQVMKKRWRRIFLSGVILVYASGVAFFTHQYFLHFAVDTSQAWQYGRREAALFADKIKQNYAKIIVSTKLEQPHVFFLYYLKYDPVKYLREGGTVSGGWAEERNKFDKYEFKRIDFAKMNDGKTLFVGLPDEFPANAQILAQIKYLDEKDAIWIVDDIKHE